MSMGEPPTLLVTIDSLRYDTATELLERTQARLDTWHDAAFATCPATMGSVPAILAGERVSDAGLPPGASVWRAFDVPTVGVTTNRLLAASYGYSQGFDTYRAPAAAADDQASITTRAAAALDTGTLAYELASRCWSGLQRAKQLLPGGRVDRAYRPAHDVVDDLLQLLPADQRTWAGWVHLMDPHHPYNPDPETRARDQRITRRVINGRGDPGDAERARECYRQEVAQVDRAVASLLDVIPDDARVIVTADHGECLGEGDTWGHQGDLRPATLRIPFGTRNIPVQSPVVSLQDTPAYLRPDRQPPDREHAHAAYGDDTAVATDEVVVGPAGAWTLDGEPTHRPPAVEQLRKHGPTDEQGVSLKDANDADLAALGYL